MNILVTGASGLIGSHLVEKLLSLGHKVFGVDDLSCGTRLNMETFIKNPNFHFFERDLAFDKKYSVPDVCGGFDVIFHLASSKKNYFGAYDSENFWKNVQMTKNVLDKATCNTRVIFASSSDVYSGRTIPMKETDELYVGRTDVVRGNYALAKIFCEQLMFNYYHDYNVPITILRIFGCFGERAKTDWRGGHMPLFIKQVLTNEEVTIHGDGEQTRTMCYVGDIVDGLIKTMTAKETIGEVINIGSDEEMSIIHHLAIIAEILRKETIWSNERIDFVPYAKVFGEYKETMRRVPDLAKAKRLLNWRCRVSLEEAIKKTAKWIKENELQ